LLQFMGEAELIVCTTLLNLKDEQVTTSQNCTISGLRPSARSDYTFF